MSENPQEMLAQAIQGKSDDEILELAGQFGGIEQLLDTTFEGMKSALDPAKAQDCVIGYELKAGDQAYPYKITIKDKAAEVEKTEPEGARVTLGLSVPDYLRLISGQLNGMQAFMQGKLKLKGDMMFAQQIQGMFGQ